MVAFTATIAIITVVATPFLATCAGVLATAGWTAPSCLVGGIAAGLAAVLGIIQDATGGATGTSSNNPETVTVTATVTAVGRRAEATPAIMDQGLSGVWFKQHDNGWSEDYTGRLHELYGLNQTTTIYHAKTGSYHTVEMREDGTAVKVRTNMRQPAFAAPGSQRLRRSRQAESPSSSWNVLSALMPRQQTSSALDSITYEAQQLTGGTDYPTSDSPFDAAAQTIADKTNDFGTYCVTISDDNGNAVADMGLTLNGPNYKVSNDEAPCKA